MESSTIDHACGRMQDHMKMSGYKSYYYACRFRVIQIVSSRYFRVAGLMFTLVNICSLCFNHYNMSQATQFNIETINFICLIYFAVEMALKLFGFGPVAYMR